MNPEVIVSIVTGLALLIGIVGIIVPILPGSITIIIGLLIWAIVVGGPVGWTVFGIGAALCVLGMVATYLLTGHVMKREQIPNRSVIVGLVCGIIGMFVIPVIGLLVGFVLGLFVAEYLRVQNAKTALRLSWEAIKASAKGILVEFTCASLAIITWVIGLVVQFT